MSSPPTVPTSLTAGLLAHAQRRQAASRLALTRTSPAAAARQADAAIEALRAGLIASGSLRSSAMRIDPHAAPVR